LSIWGRWWLWWHLGGFWSHLSCGGRVWLARGRVLAPSAPFQLAVSMGVGLRRLHAPTGFCAIGAVLIAASFCVGYLDGLPHGLGLWCW
jgi:CBS-domain-containing membrane protein